MNERARQAGYAPPPTRARIAQPKTATVPVVSPHVFAMRQRVLSRTDPRYFPPGTAYPAPLAASAYRMQLHPFMPGHSPAKYFGLRHIVPQPATYATTPKPKAKPTRVKKAKRAKAPSTTKPNKQKKVTVTTLKKELREANAEIAKWKRAWSTERIAKGKLSNELTLLRPKLNLIRTLEEKIILITKQRDQFSEANVRIHDYLIESSHKGLQFAKEAELQTEVEKLKRELVVEKAKAARVDSLEIEKARLMAENNALRLRLSEISSGGIAGGVPLPAGSKTIEAKEKPDSLLREMGFEKEDLAFFAD